MDRLIFGKIRMLERLNFGVFALSVDREIGCGQSLTLQLSLQVGLDRHGALACAALVKELGIDQSLSVTQ